MENIAIYNAHKLQFPSESESIHQAKLKEKFIQKGSNLLKNISLRSVSVSSCVSFFLRNPLSGTIVF